MTEIELKACPFCGGRKVEITSIRAGGLTWWQVECAADECQAHSGDRGSEAEAIAAWNTRPEPPLHGYAEGEDAGRPGGLSSSGPSQQAVSAVPVSIPDAGVTSLRALGVDHYHDIEWEATYDAGDNEAVQDWLWAQGHCPGAPCEISTLMKGPTVYAAEVPVSFDDDGDVEETELRFFASKELAMAAIAQTLTPKEPQP